MPTDGCHPVPADVSDSKLNATESPKLFATEKKSHDIIVLLLEQAKHQQQTVSRIRPWQNHSLAEAALCCCRLHGVRGDHRAGSWEAETRTYSHLVLLAHAPVDQLINCPLHMGDRNTLSVL